MCLGEWTVNCLCGEFTHQCNLEFIKRTTKDDQCVFFSVPIGTKANVSASCSAQTWCHHSPQDGGVCLGPRSGSRCRGFHPLQSIREASARWKMATRRQKRRGLRLNPANPPPLLLSAPPIPSLFNAIATSHILARIVSCNRASGGAGGPSWIPNAAKHATATF